MGTTKTILDKLNGNCTGIYAITCNKTWRSYIGSAYNIHNRCEQHLARLKRNTHNNRELQKDYNLYGLNSIYIEILEKTNQDGDLLSAERQWYNFGCNLYNKTPPTTEIILTLKQIKKFWKKVDIIDINKCWNWLGHHDKDGYGRVGVSNNLGVKHYRSNRLAYFLSYPCTNIDIIIRHICNNKKCCNPLHLISGSVRDNRLDRIKVK